MARRSPVKSEGAEIWRRRVEGLAASGKSCREYAAELGVNPHTLAGWRWKLRGSPATATATTASRPSTTPPARPEARGFVDVTRQVAAALVGEAGVIESLFTLISTARCDGSIAFGTRVVAWCSRL